ncbi:unnamed protein product [Rangifer tarandus platyrhynchus]|uniref:Uncharacterized protein n=1 Tax=Rangifer tarandus platyrhynchus TaxID=3082113 RepID=A0AC59ZW45_RANTA
MGTPAGQLLLLMARLGQPSTLSKVPPFPGLRTPLADRAGKAWMRVRCATARWGGARVQLLSPWLPQGEAGPRELEGAHALGGRGPHRETSRF